MDIQVCPFLYVKQMTQVVCDANDTSSCHLRVSQ